MCTWPFFEAPARRDVCVELPEETVEEGETTADIVGKLMASLYATRDASAKWQEEVNKAMKKWGFEMGTYNPCTYFHAEGKLRCLVHKYDFVCAGGVPNREISVMLDPGCDLEIKSKHKKLPTASVQYIVQKLACLPIAEP